MTHNPDQTRKSPGVPMLPTIMGGLLGLASAFGTKLLMTKGSAIGPGTTAGDILGIPLLLTFPLATLLVVVGLFLRRRRPGVFAFGVAMAVALFLPFILQ